MTKLKPTDYIDEARHLACQRDAKVQRVAKKARRAQRVLGDNSPVAVKLFAKSTRLEQEAAVLRWLASRVEEVYGEEA